MAEVEVSGDYSDENGNMIIAPPGLKNVKVIFNGENNLLIIAKNSKASNATFRFPAHEGVCLVGSNSSKWNTLSGHISVGYKCLLSIGNDVSFTNGVYVTSAEMTKIVIGDDCMFATGNQIRSDDAHAIYDVNTGTRINPSKNIVIGAHTWIAFNAIILGGAQIGDGSVIGFGSIVKGRFPNNCTIAGAPAKVIKRDTAWERPHVMLAEPWIRGDASRINKTSEFWNNTEDGSTPCLGVGFEENMRRLRECGKHSIWLEDPDHRVIVQEQAGLG